MRHELEEAIFKFTSPQFTLKTTVQNIRTYIEPLLSEKIFGKTCLRINGIACSSPNSSCGPPSRAPDKPAQSHPRARARPLLQAGRRPGGVAAAWERCCPAIPTRPQCHTPGLRSDPDRASILPKSTHRANSKPCQGFPPPAPAAARRLPPP